MKCGGHDTLENAEYMLIEPVVCRANFNVISFADLSSHSQQFGSTRPLVSTR